MPEWTHKAENAARNGTFARLKWGILVALAYLCVALPCSFAYWHEYSIPGMIWYWASMPALPFRGLAGGGWSDTDHIVARLVLTAIAGGIYFALGLAVAAIIRTARRDEHTDP